MTDESLNNGENLQPAVEQAPEAVTTETVTTSPETTTPYAFTAPEGVVMDDAVLTAYTEAAQALNLPHEAAQTIVDKIAPLMAQRQSETMAAMSDDWQAQARVDPEFGGDKLAENLATAKQAMEALATPALKQLLESTLLGNHPEIIRLFVRAGKQLSEDRFVPSGGSATLPRDPAALLFPTMQN